MALDSLIKNNKKNEIIYCKREQIVETEDNYKSIYLTGAPIDVVDDNSFSRFNDLEQLDFNFFLFE